MARTATLLELRTQAQTRADMTGSQFLSTTEWNTLINQSWTAYYDMLVNAQAAPVTSSTITSTGVATYALPTDFYALVNIARVDASGNPLDELERYDLADLTTEMIGGDKEYPKYRVQSIVVGAYSASVSFAPAPTTGLLYLVTYHPVALTLVNDADKIDGIDGFEEFIVCDAAAKAVEKEDGDSRALLGRAQAAQARIEAQLPQRDQFKSQTVRDVERGDLMGGLPLWRR